MQAWLVSAACSSSAAGTSHRRCPRSSAPRPCSLLSVTSPAASSLRRGCWTCSGVSPSPNPARPNSHKSGETNRAQAPPTPPSIPGFTPSRVSSLAAASSPPPPPAPRASCRRGTSSARSSASGRCRGSRARPRRAWGTCSACWAWGPVCCLRFLLAGSRLRRWCSLGALRLLVALLVGFPCSLDEADLSLRRRGFLGS